MLSLPHFTDEDIEAQGGEVTHRRLLEKPGPKLAGTRHRSRVADTVAQAERKAGEVFSAGRVEARVHPSLGEACCAPGTTLGTLPCRPHGSHGHQFTTGKLRKEMQLTHGHAVTERKSWDLNPGEYVPNPCTSLPASSSSSNSFQN